MCVTPYTFHARQWGLLLCLLSALTVGMASEAWSTTNNFIPIDVPGTTEIIAIDGINNRGQVVGSFDDVSGQHGFVDDHGQFTTIDYPGVTHTSANGINASGQVIGSAESSSGAFYGYSEKNQNFTTLFQGVFGNRYVVSGINAQGDVVGRTDFPSGADGFLRTAKGQVQY